MNTKPKIWPVGTKLISIDEVTTMTGLTPFEIRRLIIKGYFPESIRYSENPSVIRRKWPLPQIEAWLANRDVPIPRWYRDLIREFLALRNATHADDINRQQLRVYGYIYALYTTSTIDDDQFNLLNSVASNAMAYAVNDSKQRGFNHAPI
jgi:predicted DNA-binding transcriptional regulator AlpA